jgi:hypothetical protein
MMKYQKNTAEEKNVKQSKLGEMCKSMVEEYAKKGRVLYDKNGNVHTAESFFIESEEVFSSEKFKKWEEVHK